MWRISFETGSSEPIKIHIIVKYKLHPIYSVHRMQDIELGFVGRYTHTHTQTK